MRLKSAAIGIAVAFCSTPSGAEVCARPDLIDTFPADGASNVPTNTLLRARYQSTAEYVDENVTFHGPDPGGSDITVGFRPDEACVDPLAGSFCFNKNEGILNLRPPADLDPGGSYTIEWPSLRGSSTTARGDGRKVTFTVGDGPDVQAPNFEGLRKIFWDLDRERDECTEAEQDRFYFDLTPGPASDDFDTELLALRVFQTKGPTLPAGKRTPVALFRFPTDLEPVRVELSVTNATGDVCFAAQVEDLKAACVEAGACDNKSSADKEVCTTTVAPPFFYGCGIAPSERPGRPLSAWPVTLLLLLAGRRRHRSSS